MDPNRKSRIFWSIILPSPYPTFGGKTIETGIYLNRVKILIYIPFKRGWLCLVPWICITRRIRIIDIICAIIFFFVYLFNRFCTGLVKIKMHLYDYCSDNSKVSSDHGNPNATIDPPTPLYDCTLPVPEEIKQLSQESPPSSKPKQKEVSKGVP